MNEETLKQPDLLEEAKDILDQFVNNKLELEAATENLAEICFKIMTNRELRIFVDALHVEIQKYNTVPDFFDDLINETQIKVFARHVAADNIPPRITFEEMQNRVNSALNRNN